MLRWRRPESSHRFLHDQTTGRRPLGRLPVSIRYGQVRVATIDRQHRRLTTGRSTMLSLIRRHGLLSVAGRRTIVKISGQSSARRLGLVGSPRAGSPAPAHTRREARADSQVTISRRLTHTDGLRSPARRKTLVSETYPRTVCLPGPETTPAVLASCLDVRLSAARVPVPGANPRSSGFVGRRSTRMPTPLGDRAGDARVGESLSCPCSPSSRSGPRPDA